MHVQHAENKQIHVIKVIRYLQFWGDFLTFQCSLFSKQDYPAFKRAIMVWMALRVGRVCGAKLQGRQHQDPKDATRRPTGSRKPASFVADAGITEG